MSFEDKKKALFASLESAERSIPVDSVLHQDDKVDYNRDRSGRESHSGRRDRRGSASMCSPIKKFRGKESIFKRPAAPISKCLAPSRVPDFKKNPQKWTKYSLEDVDTSDRTNTAAAFSFLREMENKKRDQQDEEGTAESASTGFRGKVRFNRSIKLKSKLEEDDEPPPTEQDKPKVKGSKVIMPEYVIGQKTKKNKSVKLGAVSIKRDRSKELKLDHLMDDEDSADATEDIDEDNGII